MSECDSMRALAEAEAAGLDPNSLRGHSAEFIRAHIKRLKPTKTYAEGLAWASSVVVDPAPNVGGVSWEAADRSVVVDSQGGRPVAASSPGPQAPTDAKIKQASAKVPFFAIAFRALKGVCRVFGYGRKKYSAGGFLAGTDDEAPDRYLGAALRHLADCQNLDGTYTWASLSKLDDESGLPELDHAICGLIMIRGICVAKGVLPEDPGQGNEPPKAVK